MSKLPILPAHEIIRVLKKTGFAIVRQRGSHIRLVQRNDPTRYATVAMHGSDVPRKDVASILRQSKISAEEFLRLLRQ